MARDMRVENPLQEEYTIYGEYIVLARLARGVKDPAQGEYTIYCTGSARYACRGPGLRIVCRSTYTAYLA